MAAPQDVSLPPFFTLADGMQVVVTAVDATTGNTVSGVVVSNVSLSVDPVGGGGEDVKIPPVSPDYFEGET